MAAATRERPTRIAAIEIPALGDRDSGFGGDGEAACGS